MDTQIGEDARQECSMDNPGKTVSRKRPRRTFTLEFKAESVRLCRVGDRSIYQVAKDLDLSETTLREWVRRSDSDAGKGPAGSLTSDERAASPRDQAAPDGARGLKRAAKYFARESP